MLQVQFTTEDKEKLDELWEALQEFKAEKAKHNEETKPIEVTPPPAE